MIQSSGVVMEALGIAVGDKVWCPYSEAGRMNPVYYKVKSIFGPHWWLHDLEFVIWPYPVISLGLEYWDRKSSGQPGINNIHKDDERWFDDHGNELFVEKPKKKRYLAVDLFPSQTRNFDNSFPYKFNPDLDYSDPNRIFKCQSCSLDFNGELVRKFVTPYCPVCGFKGGVSRKIIVMEKVIPGRRYWGAYQRILGFNGRPPETAEYYP